MQLCKNAASSENGPECVAFYHGVTAGALAHATPNHPLGVCVPSGIKSAQVVERAARHIEDSWNAGNYGETLYTGKAMLVWLQRAYPCR